MKQVTIFEPELIGRRGFNGFYHHFLSALVEHVGARGTDAPRPLPRMIQPREHESCWIEWSGELVFFDMSDHVQLMDLEALKLCGVYFKANLHRGIALRLLKESSMEDEAHKLVPFLFFAEGLSDFVRYERWRRFWGTDTPRYDICFVMGVYRNPVRDGRVSPFLQNNGKITSSEYHFWIRWHAYRALQEAGIPGYYRLTSRGNRSLEDGVNVFGNLNRRPFSRCITQGRLTAVCTLPHALFPWKASESFALGRPILIEQAPLTETPEPFRLREGTHFLELLPNCGDFNAIAPISDPASYRILNPIVPARFAERVEWLRGVLSDRRRMSYMGEECRKFAARAYDKKTVAEYICAEVEKRIG